MRDRPADNAPTGPEPAERTTRQVWKLGAKILAIQVVTILLLWWLQATYAGGG